MTIKTDVVVVGGGPCGIFAVFELGLLGIRTHVVDSLDMIGGQCTTLYPEKPIYDIPGLPSVTGQELVDRLAQQATPFDPTYHLGQQVVELGPQDDGSFVLVTGTGTQLHTRTVIIAAGLGAFLARPLRLAGVEDFVGANLHYLVEDKTRFQNKNIVILGGGDSAIDWVLALAPIARSVTLVHRRDSFRASKIMQDKANANEKISFELDTVVAEVKDVGKGVVSSVVLRNIKAGGTKEIAVDGVFIAIGHTPNTSLVTDQIELDQNAYIVPRRGTETSVSGVFACGDVQDHVYRQAITAAGSGCMAAIDAERYLENCS